jgi:uncharacterized protein GlcG (DUF336 family)
MSREKVRCRRANRWFNGPVVDGPMDQAFENEHDTPDRFWSHVRTDALVSLRFWYRLAMRTLSICTVAVMTVLSIPARAQAPAASSRPQSIDIVTGRRALAAAIARATAASVRASVAVVDVNSDLVAFERMDGAVSPSILISQGKAHAALMFGMSTADLQDAIAAGRPVTATITMQGEHHGPVRGGHDILSFKERTFMPTKVNVVLDDDVKRDLDRFVDSGMRSRVVNRALRREILAIRRERANRTLEKLREATKPVTTADLVIQIRKDRGR